MNRQEYFDYIRRKLAALSSEIDIGGKLNVLDLHAHSENFYQYFFKELFGWNLENLNTNLHNVEAIDLIAHSPDDVIIQVSATCSKDKIENALSKEIINSHKGYCFKFISISKDASSLKKNSYSNPFGITFNPGSDIYDIPTLLGIIKALSVDDQKRIYRFIKKELGEEIDILKLDSNLASIVNILSKEDFDKNDATDVVDSFEIERKISFNNLDAAKYVIDDYGLYHNRLDKIYSEYDASAVNKSSSALASIRKEYTQNKKLKNCDELFFLVLDKVQNKIIESANFSPIPIEELEVCVNVIVVDAFIRCKIFENPNNYKYASS